MAWRYIYDSIIKHYSLRKIYECERASLENIRVFTFKNYYFLQYSVGTYDTLSQKHIFSGLRLHLHI